MEHGERFTHMVMRFLNERHLLEQEASVCVTSQGLNEGHGFGASSFILTGW